MSADGYRAQPSHGARVRTDIVDVYIFRRPGAGEPEFLQLLRSGEPLDNTWHPVMGHIEVGESAVECAVRELREEVGLGVPSAPLLGLFALEQVHPFYIAAIDTIVLSPRFAAEVTAAWEPTINREHTRWRWIPSAEAHERFMWPGQLASVREIIASLLPERSLSREHLRVRG